MCSVGRVPSLGVGAGQRFASIADQCKSSNDSLGRWRITRLRPSFPEETKPCFAYSDVVLVALADNEDDVAARSVSTPDYLAQQMVADSAVGFGSGRPVGRP
jgi:hypothetical protein